MGADTKIFSIESTGASGVGTVSLREVVLLLVPTLNVSEGSHLLSHKQYVCFRR